MTLLLLVAAIQVILSFNLNNISIFVHARGDW